jgi:O-antigen/teichoic acid export membrane protein
MLIALLLVARIVTKAEYGEFGLIRTTISMFAILGGLGLGLTANRFVAEYRHSRRDLCGGIIGTSYVLAAASGLLVAGGLFVGANYVADTLLNAPRLASSLRLAAILLALNAVNGAQVGILQGLDAYRSLAIGNLCQGFVGMLAMVIGARLAGGQGALGGLTVYTIAGLLIFNLLLRREQRRQQIVTRYDTSKAVALLVWRFGIPAALAGIAVAPFKWLVETMLARRAGFEALAVFHAGMAVIGIYVAVVYAINAPLISLAASERGGKSETRIKYVSLYGSWYLFLLFALPAALFPKLPSLFFGAAYASNDVYSVTLILSLYCGLLVYYQGIVRLMAMRGSLWFAFGTNLVESATLMVAFAVLSKRGVMALALAYVASYFARIALSVPYLVSRKLASWALILDKGFLFSLLAFILLLWLQLAHLS